MQGNILWCQHNCIANIRSQELPVLRRWRCRPESVRGVLPTCHLQSPWHRRKGLAGRCTPPHPAVRTGQERLHGPAAGKLVPSDTISPTCIQLTQENYDWHLTDASRSSTSVWTLCQDVLLRMLTSDAYFGDIHIMKQGMVLNWAIPEICSYVN